MQFLYSFPHIQPRYSISKSPACFGVINNFNVLSSPRSHEGSSDSTSRYKALNSTLLCEWNILSVLG